MPTAAGQVLVFRLTLFGVLSARSCMSPSLAHQRLCAQLALTAGGVGLHHTILAYSQDCLEMVAGVSRWSLSPRTDRI